MLQSIPRTSGSFLVTKLEVRKWTNKFSWMEPLDHWIPSGDECSDGLILHIDPKISKILKKKDKNSL